jgi:hypothetical protein
MTSSAFVIFMVKIPANYWQPPGPAAAEPGGMSGILDRERFTAPIVTRGTRELTQSDITG